jgi:hypothetical protein
MGIKSIGGCRPHKFSVRFCRRIKICLDLRSALFLQITRGIDNRVHRSVIAIKRAVIREWSIDLAGDVSGLGLSFCQARDNDRIELLFPDYSLQITNIDGG